MADTKSKDVNGVGSPTPNGIPTGTSQQSDESLILKRLKALNVRNFDTLKDVVLSGVKGEPIDDKTYLMEHIVSDPNGVLLKSFVVMAPVHFPIQGLMY